MAPFGRVVTLPPSYPNVSPKHLFIVDVTTRPKGAISFLSRHMHPPQYHMYIRLTRLDSFRLISVVITCNTLAKHDSYSLTSR